MWPRANMGPPFEDVGVAVQDGRQNRGICQVDPAARTGTSDSNLDQRCRLEADMKLQGGRRKPPLEAGGGLAAGWASETGESRTPVSTKMQEVRLLKRFQVESDIAP